MSDFSETPTALRPEGVEALLLQGEMLFSSGDLEKARVLFHQVHRMDPENPRLLNNLGVIACQDEDIDLALDLWRRACIPGPVYRKALLNFVQVLQDLDRGEEAIPMVSRYLELYPDDLKILAIGKEIELQNSRGTVTSMSSSIRIESAKPMEKFISVAWRNRPDMLDARGGDGTVIEETTQCLVQLGHKADILLDPIVDLRPYDIVHLNNISRTRETLEQLQEAKGSGKRTVLTSLYEDMDRYLQPAMRTDLVFRYLATKKMKYPLKEIQKLCNSFKLESNPLDEPVARHFGIGDKEKQSAILRGVDLILTSGKGESDSIRNAFGKTAPIMELHYGFNRSFQNADPRLFSERHGLKDFALCVGRLEPRKNQWQLIEIFRSLPHLKLVLVGRFSDPSMEPLIMSYAPSNVIFFNRLSPEELASVYAAARIHILPSWYELPGLVSLEAAAAGSRVATTDWGTARDYFGDLAYYLQPDNPIQMKKVILEAFDSDPRPGLREHVLENFTWEKTARSVADAYRQVLAKG